MVDTKLGTCITILLSEIDNELKAFKNYFDNVKSCFPKESFFDKPVCVYNSKIEPFDLEKIPKKKGIYIFSLVEPLSPEECAVLRDSKGTKLRKEYEKTVIKSGKILYIGSCKTMTFKSRIAEHVSKAGEGVCSLRLQDEGRNTLMNKIRIDCFAFRNINDREEVAKLVLPLIEEKLQKDLKPLCGRYRG